jgi:IS30 family transposase
LAATWSPEQIAGYVRRHRVAGLSISHETIYQYVYGADGRRQELWRYLPRARRSRRQRCARKPRGVNIPLANTISERLPEIGERTSFGHWEGDLLAFRKEFGKANLRLLVERRSRYTVLTHNPSRHLAGVMVGIDRHLRAFPPALRRSVTLDRGTEFTAFAVLKARLDITSYFRKPSAPWQKGSVENNNGRIRRFPPLDTDIALTSDRELQLIVDRLNRTPSKCLDYQTPHEVLGAQVALLKTD